MVMTELQWLIKLLTQHKLSPSLKDLFIERIGEVETRMSSQDIRRQTNPMNPLAQAPSTQRILDQLDNHDNTTSDGIIVNSPIAAQALQARQQAIAQAASGTPEKGRTSPRKF